MMFEHIKEAIRIIKGTSPEEVIGVLVGDKWIDLPRKYFDDSVELEEVK